MNLASRIVRSSHTEWKSSGIADVIQSCFKNENLKTPFEGLSYEMIEPNPKEKLTGTRLRCATLHQASLANRRMSPSFKDN